MRADSNKTKGRVYTFNFEYQPKDQMGFIKVQIRAVFQYSYKQEECYHWHPS